LQSSEKHVSLILSGRSIPGAAGHHKSGVHPVEAYFVKKIEKVNDEIKAR
jgi:hypothetical protein